MATFFNCSFSFSTTEKVYFIIKYLYKYDPVGWGLNTSTNRSELPGEFRNVVLEKNGEVIAKLKKTHIVLSKRADHTGRAV
jgi:hypothetical protein